MNKLADVAYTGLNKKLMIIVGGVAVTLIGGLVCYTLFTGNTVQQQDAQIKLLKQPSNINLVVNNILNNIPVESQNPSNKAILVPIDQGQSKVAMMGAPNGEIGTAIGDPGKPQMFTNNDATPKNNDEVNAVTGTNTAIGNGTIDSKLKSQRSPYTVFAGSYIPAQMVNGINSDLNGMVIAQVRNDVYDTIKGKYLLIPQGSRIVGTYNHDIAYGQSRLMVGWNRIIYPNGASFSLHGQPGTDLEGFSGFSDDVDNHYMKIFGSAFIMGAIFGGTSLAAGNQNTNPYQLSAGATMANQVGAQMAQAGIQVINKGLNVQPALIIHPGYQFDVSLTADLVLKPYIYKNGEYN
jgi:type IV secretion system protein TrbI